MSRCLGRVGTGSWRADKRPQEIFASNFAQLSVLRQIIFSFQLNRCFLPLGKIVFMAKDEKLSLTLRTHTHTSTYTFAHGERDE